MKRHVRFSAHSITRQAQRNLSALDIDFIATYGHSIHSAGARHVFLRRRDIPGDKATYQRFAHLEGTTLVLKDEDEYAVLITAYRNRNGQKAIRAKSKRFVRVETGLDTSANAADV
jgi:hypothetical protein